MLPHPDLLIMEATGETDPNVLREIKQILAEPQLEAHLGHPGHAASYANQVRQIRRKS